MRRARIATLATATLVAAGVAVSSATAHAATTSRIPAHVFAPYFEAYNGDSLSGLSSQSGDKFLTLAFVQTPSPGSCTVYFNGDTSMPIASGTFGSDIAAIRAAGGDVIPSFGGYAADNGGTEIADSCTNVDSIAAQLEKVVTTYDVTRIDLDIEDNSLTNTAGIDRRNKAIKKVEDWAAANGRLVEFSYTLPTTTSGLADSGLAVLRNAVSNGARIDIVNMMTFDYYDNAAHNMATDTQTSANGLVNQLRSLYPSKTTAQLWQMVGITEMIGVDDFGPAETFTLANAQTVTDWAKAQGIRSLSFWALQRDNGGCPGGAAADNCSGVAQSTWQFSHIMQSFTAGGGTTTPPTTKPTTAPTTTPPTTTPPTTTPPTTSPTTPPTTTPPGTTTWAPYTAYTAGQIVTYNGKRYQCRQSHTSLPGWEPPNVLALWLPL
ncbi:carbohydrate-binding protein [Actinoplanes sp. CA-030573]|uniref:carbohydrate-binding protein n=1 Tax=Actinoplanes sp. CA-030573 TaxID=3239898 RepID=UPI003D91D792